MNSFTVTNAGGKLSGYSKMMEGELSDIWADYSHDNFLPALLLYE